MVMAKGEGGQSIFLDIASWLITSHTGAGKQSKTFLPVQRAAMHCGICSNNDDGNGTATNNSDKHLERTTLVMYHLKYLTY